jgi:chromosome partition protein MukE
MIYQSLEAVIADPLFARADLDLRRGRHIGADYDPFLFDFLTNAKPFLDSFYSRYEAVLLSRQEGYFYLLPDRLALPPPLGQRHLGAIDMLVGQALALMRLDPKWLESNLRIPEMAALDLLEQILGEERLLRFIPRRRGKDVDQDARKLREAYVSALRALERQCFIKREGRGNAVLIRPLVAVMRFADPVRTSEERGVTLESLIANGEIADTDEDADSNTEEPKEYV